MGTRSSSTNFTQNILFRCQILRVKWHKRLQCPDKEPIFPYNYVKITYVKFDLRNRSFQFKTIPSIKPSLRCDSCIYYLYIGSVLIVVVAKLSLLLASDRSKLKIEYSSLNITQYNLFTEMLIFFQQRRNMPT